MLSKQSSALFKYIDLSKLIEESCFACFIFGKTTNYGGEVYLPCYIRLNTEGTGPPTWFEYLGGAKAGGATMVRVRTSQGKPGKLVTFRKSQGISPDFWKSQGKLSDFIEKSGNFVWRNLYEPCVISGSQNNTASVISLARPR